MRRMRACLLISFFLSWPFPRCQKADSLIKMLTPEKVCSISYLWQCGCRGWRREWRNCQGKENTIFLGLFSLRSDFWLLWIRGEYPCLSHGLINLEEDWVGGKKSKNARNIGLWNWRNSFLISNSSCTHPWTTQMFKWDVWGIRKLS